MTETKVSRSMLHQLIVRQLEHDGYAGVATAVAEATYAPSNPLIASDRLACLVTAALAAEKSGKPLGIEEPPPERLITPQVDLGPAARGPGITDLDRRGRRSAPRPHPSYASRFTLTHQAPVRCGVFAPNGNLVATGSADGTVMLVDIDCLRTSKEGPPSGDKHPVLRTYRDHVQAINDVAFHPRSTILASAARDCQIKLYNYAKALSHRPYRSMQDGYNVRSIAFHPTGDYLLVGTDHPLLHIYDVSTGSCYVLPDDKDAHMGPVNQACYSIDGSVYASAGKDGTIKIWDGVTNRCVNTIRDAHQGSEVCSVRFTRNTKYLLSGGKDSTGRLWELSTGAEVVSYRGFAQQRARQQMTFSNAEDYVLAADERTLTVVGWDARTGDMNLKMPCHSNIVRWIGSSPTEAAFVTCSDDTRARFWWPTDLPPR